MLIKTENTDLGLLTLDNRNAPVGKNTFIEVPTFTCTHCEGVVVMNPNRTRDRTFCKGCSHLICDNCAAIKANTGECKTYKQQLDELLEIEIKS